MKNIQKFPISYFDYKVIEETKFTKEYYPVLRSDNGKDCAFCISPNHGRSFIVSQSDSYYTVIKGSGLTYTSHVFYNTGELGDYTWGLLLKKDALRDFHIGQEINSLGIKTNLMDCILELETSYFNPYNNKSIKPIILQYKVECPYRICDFAFMPKQSIERELNKWDSLNRNNGYKKRHLMAANVLIENLAKMHQANILHNAIHNQNYTWALELLDFELARTPNYPYSNENDECLSKLLYHREYIQTYEIINYIACCLCECIDYKEVDNLFAKYGFDLKR